jgi:hypothetical protein
MTLNNFIEEYNEDGFVGTVKSVFVRLTAFLTMVARANRQSEINLEMLEGDDFGANPGLFDFLSKNGFLDDVDYEGLDDDIRNYYLEWWLENDEDSALQYVCDHLLTDVENRSGQYWLYLRDNDELSVFFESYHRETSPQDLAKAILGGDDFFDRFWDTTDDVYRDVIDDLNDENKNRLSHYIVKQIGNQELSLDDYDSELFNEFSEEQGTEGFFTITSENVMELISNEKAMNELLNGDLDDLKSELDSLHNSAYNNAYESECYDLVNNGLEDYFTSKIVEEPFETGGNTKYRNYIRIRDFGSYVSVFVNENKGYTYSDSLLEYFGSYVGMMGKLFDDGVYDQISFRIPEYADWDDTRKNINDYFGDYI